jgi:hypothetical protein
VLVRPFVTVHLTSISVLQGRDAFMSFTATGAPPLGYKWIRNSSSALVPPTDVPFLVISNIQANNTLRVQATNRALPNPNTGSGALSPGPAVNNNVNIIMLADADGDGMWDIWETNHFGNVAGTNFALVSPTGDADGDGMNNRDEYNAGTNPTNALSLLNIVLTATNANVLQFVAQTGLTYSVQYRTNLTAALWATVTNISSSSNTVRTIQVDSVTAPAGAERYFRVITPRSP